MLTYINIKKEKVVMEEMNPLSCSTTLSELEFHTLSSSEQEQLLHLQQT